MEDKQIVIILSVLLLLTVIFIFFVPFSIIFIPIFVAIIYHIFKLPQTEINTTVAFFHGFSFGGHRGSPHSYPENSFSGFQEAKKEGADLIEFDLALTKDGIAVLVHDDTLDRTTNLQGPVKDKTLKELQDANLAVKFQRSSLSPAHHPVPKESIPTLESVVAWSVKNEMKMLFDVKDHSDQMVGIIVDLFAKYNLYNSTTVCSFYPWVVYKVKKASPTIVTGLTWRQNFIAYSDLEKQVPRYTFALQFAAEVLDFIYLYFINSFLPTFLGVDLLLTNEQDINPGFLAACNSKNLKVVVWTVNDILQANWMMRSLHIPILTDYPFYSSHIKKLNNFIARGFQ